MRETFPDRSDYDEPGSIAMDVHELVMRFASGGRFRLVAMLDVLPCEPPKVGGEWPRILFAEYVNDGYEAPILFGTEAQPGEAYEAYPTDRVVVIPIPPAQAARELELAARGRLDG
ncbi:hypothetical protein [Nonomuraea wenchangensis]|uniref:Uncharacterized protein n=1 Tax=Nonomuraea wenchangensis TaxID=568860 RepID=A0A1I0LUP8_9ACTN|nr:hypothetical protein [Nonomuraea wenchangensis]SEU46502.1 hypothetical protein SAMN05421811_12756 [Nonomuraea wenchangensis]